MCSFLFIDNYSGEGLVFDWSQKINDAPIDVPEDPILTPLNIIWESYKGW